MTDSFRIVGNPRNEAIHFGSDMSRNSVTEERITEAMKQIRQEPEWMAHVREKAVQNKVPLEEQLYLDAIWTINRDIRKGTTNSRWKRNPRMGNYRFILVVTTRDGLA